MEDQQSTPRTTADSAQEQRLKVSIVTKKKKTLKKMVQKMCQS